MEIKETIRKPLKLIRYGPDNVIAGQIFNEQPNGDSAIWTETDGATDSTVLVLNDVNLVSCVQNDGNLVTAIVPAWLYQYSGEFYLYLLDIKTNIKSNAVQFLIKEPTSHIAQNDKKIIMDLKQQNIELHKKLEMYNREKAYKFVGWQMASDHELPWVDKYNWSVFRKSCEDIKKGFNFGLTETIGITAENVDTLMWRHWIISFSTRYALEFSRLEDNIISAECGVGDGMSAFFVLREMTDYKKNNPNIECTMHLYDSWNLLRKEELLESEYNIIGKYNDNCLNRTKENLIEFEDNLVYHIGYIPESFETSRQIDGSMIYLHIDLNSAKPTYDALQFFYPKLISGSVILFDDYGWEGFEDTKEIIDDYFANKQGILMKLPTGQAIYFIR
jgi:hypothetical protein